MSDVRVANEVEITETTETVEGVEVMDGVQSVPVDLPLYHVQANVDGVIKTGDVYDTETVDEEGIRIFDFEGTKIKETDILVYF